MVIGGVFQMKSTGGRMKAPRREVKNLRSFNFTHHILAKREA
jgi:hypothetical protein